MHDAFGVELSRQVLHLASFSNNQKILASALGLSLRVRSPLGFLGESGVHTEHIEEAVRCFHYEVTRLTHIR